MKFLISVSSFGISSDQFSSQLQEVTDTTVEIQPLNWQLGGGGNQKLLDYLDTRDGQKILIDTAEQMVEYINKAKNLNQDIVIFSIKAGSRIVEEALSMVKNLDQVPVSIHHVMLAPEINGTDWKSIGKYAASVLMLGAAGIAALASSSKKGKAAALLGALGSVALSKKDTLSDRIGTQEGGDEEDMNSTSNFVNIDRTILYNPEDASFDLLTKNLPKSTFYKGVYPIEELISLREEHLDQEFRKDRWLGKVTKSKREILRSSL